MLEEHIKTLIANTYFSGNDSATFECSYDVFPLSGGISEALGTQMGALVPANGSGASLKTNDAGIRDVTSWLTDDP